MKSLDRICCGGIVVSPCGTILACNTVAERILDEEARGARPSGQGLDRGGDTAVKALLARGRTRLPRDSEDWTLVERPGRRPLVVLALPAPPMGAEDPPTLLLLLDLDHTALPSTDAMERAFGLTPAEARLAVHLARGATLAEVAEQHGLSVHTVRTQLAAVFGKTGTGRQAELVALVLRLAILP
ncbi:helix-turn-helix transcriptional regulator [Methylobacterium sp. JK268]